MAIRVAINGFGRIGRLVFRVLKERTGYEVVAINDLAPSKSLAHLLKYDTVHGRYPGVVEGRDGGIVVDGVETKVIGERDPAAMPWRDHGIDFVVKATGIFASQEQCMTHVEAGAKKVKVTSKLTCLVGDEMKWKSMPIGYVAPPYVEPGMGIAKSVMLGPDQKTMKTKVEGKNVVIKGSVFMAKFMVMMMAKAK